MPTIHQTTITASIATGTKTTINIGKSTTETTQETITANTVLSTTTLEVETEKPGIQLLVF